MSRPRCALLVGPLFGLLALTNARAQSPLVVELETVAIGYHEDPSRLDRLRDGWSRRSEPTPTCRTWWRWPGSASSGAIFATRTRDERLEAYERGRQAARRAVELSPKNAAAHFWYATNAARWGQTKGVVRSLFLLPNVQEEIRTILDRDPTFTAVYALAGNVFYEVPGLLGGDLNRAEEMFRQGLRQDPRFTGLRVGLSKTLIRTGRTAEARRELQAVLDEKEPTNRADWTLKDTRQAHALLDSLKGR
jgi:hypothetical protein